MSEKEETLLEEKEPLQETEKEPEKEPEKEEEPEKQEEDKPEEEPADEAPSLDDIRANVRKHDEALKEEREDFEFLESKLQSVRADAIKSLPEISSGGKSIYDMTPEEFDDAIDRTYRTTEDRAEAAKLVANARQARKDYLKKVDPYVKSAAKLAQDAEKFREKEWNLAEKELLALYPGINKYAPEIKEAAIKQLTDDVLLVDRVNKGVVAKFRYLVNLVKELGIESKLTKAELEKEQGNREKALAGKGKPSGSASRETAYTPERIRKMSLEEYRSHKDKIKAAMRSAKAKQ